MAEEKEKSVKALWKDCQGLFKEKFTETVYSTWFAPIKASAYDVDKKGFTSLRQVYTMLNTSKKIMKKIL